jgi:hypothetical protein
VVVDVISPVERPKKPTTRVFRQETASQVLVGGQPSTRAIITCTAQAKARVHDFRLFKTSQVRLAATIQLF